MFLMFALPCFPMVLQLKQQYGAGWQTTVQQALQQRDALQQLVADKQRELVAVQQQHCALADARQQLQRELAQKVAAMQRQEQQNLSESQATIKKAGQLVHELRCKLRDMEKQLLQSAKQQCELQQQLRTEREYYARVTAAKVRELDYTADALHQLQLQCEELKTELAEADGDYQQQRSRVLQARQRQQARPQQQQQEQQQQQQHPAAYPLRRFQQRKLRGRGRTVTAAAAHQLQRLVQRFNLHGAHLRELMLGVLQLVLLDDAGQPLSEAQLQQLVQLPAASTIYQHTRIYGEWLMARNACALLLSPCWVLMADSGKVLTDKRLMVIAGLLFKGRPILLRMPAIKAASNGGVDLKRAVQKSALEKGVMLARLSQVITDAASANHSRCVELQAARDKEVQQLLDMGLAFEAVDLVPCAVLPELIAKHYVPVAAS
jgi:hypothetical protein